MSNYVEAFVRDQLEIRGITGLSEKQIKDLTHWFEYWFDDSFDTISDCFFYAFKDCGIDKEVP